MGKGTIISHIADGKYQVQLNLHRVRLDAKISELESRITDLTTYIGTLPAGSDKVQAQLLLTSYEKKKTYLENNMPADIKLDAWCADLTTDLTGEVGTIEVPGERGEINIQPGYDGNAVYDIDRDGQLQPAIAGSPFNTLFNWCLLPAWQKWKPTYRYGTISDLSGDTCTVTLETAESSQQSLNINRDKVLKNVPIEYMGVDAGAFENGDSCIVEFVGQDPDDPKVIGFKDNPRAWIEGWNGPLITTKNAWSYYSDPGDYWQLSSGNLICNNSVDSSYGECEFTFSPVLTCSTFCFKINAANISPAGAGRRIIVQITFSNDEVLRLGFFPTGLPAGPYTYAYDASSEDDGVEHQHDLTAYATYPGAVKNINLFWSTGSSDTITFNTDYLYFQ